MIFSSQNLIESTQLIILYSIDHLGSSSVTLRSYETGAAVT